MTSSSEKATNSQENNDLENNTDAADVVTPWTVTTSSAGGVDYEKLMGLLLFVVSR
jgi:hypothetical protein